MLIYDYNKFLLENVQKHKSILARKMEEAEKLKDILSKNPGFTGEFTRMLFEGIPLIKLEELYKELLYLKSKGKNINIDELPYDKIINTIELEKEFLKINVLLKRFPKKQRFVKFIAQFSERERKLLLKLIDSPNLELFVSKVSKYKSRAKMFEDIDLFLQQSVYKKEDVLTPSKNAKLFYHDDDIVILDILDVKGIKEYANDTSWCIKDKSTFDNYKRRGHQFIVFNFKEDITGPNFKIGVTTSKTGVVLYAFDRTDKSVKNDIRKTFKDISIESLISMALIKQEEGRFVRDIYNKVESIFVESEDSLDKDGKYKIFDRDDFREINGCVILDEYNISVEGIFKNAHNKKSILFLCLLFEEYKKQETKYKTFGSNHMTSSNIDVNRFDDLYSGNEGYLYILSCYRINGRRIDTNKDKGPDSIQNRFINWARTNGIYIQS